MRLFLLVALASLVGCDAVLGIVEFPYSPDHGGADASATDGATQSGGQSDSSVDSAIRDAGPDVSGEDAARAELAVTPASFDFLPQDVGTNSADQMFRVTNAGVVSSSALAASLSGTNAGEFVIVTDTCSRHVLAPRSVCAVTVRFVPLSFGSKKASLDITGGGGASAALTGTGRDTVSLTVKETGTGTGTVTGDQIDCGSTCSESVTRTSSAPTVILLATPALSSSFVGWSGGGCSGTGQCAVTLSAAETVTATFALVHYSLTLNTTFFGPAAATITSVPAGIATTTAGTTSAIYISGQTVMLTVANPTTLWRWGGACSGTGPTCTLLMSSAQTVDLTVTANNYVFVTSTTYAGDLGGQSGGDARCQARALAAGLPGHYQAWLSTSTSNANARLAATGANGWIRVDGLPFTSSLTALTTTFQVYYTPVVSELGTAYGSVAFTGTNADGTAISGGTCTDWTVTSGNGGGGDISNGPRGWTFKEEYGCSVGESLYCFGTDINRPLAIAAASGRRAFVTKGAFDTGSGIAGADALCQTEASSAGLANPTNFLALLATTTATAASRLDLGGAPWIRTDGLPIAASATDFVNEALTAAVSVHADGKTYARTFAVSGASSPTTLGTGATTCGDWSNSTAAGGFPGVGDPAYADSRFFALFTSNDVSCGNASASVYCFDR